MINVTVPKTEYNLLKQQAAAYRRFVAQVFENFLTDSVKNVVDDFRQTDLYSDSFLQDLEEGLADSSYLRKYDYQAPKATVRKISRRASARPKMA
ncbi:MAG: hypothetical protein M1127_01245 [Patescibacteria group bacterium]|nr:hypothetical protein [Patescibacteria group bacterium]